MAETQMQKHLRTYVKDGMLQKMRLNQTIEAYKIQEIKTKERVIDERELRASQVAAGIDPVKVEYSTERIVRDEDILEVTRSTLNESQAAMDELTRHINSHLEELTDIELLQGGFVRHTIGEGKNVFVDQEDGIIRFKSGGHVEVPIAARLTKWRDSSQLTIKRIEKE